MANGFYTYPTGYRPVAYRRPSRATRVAALLGPEYIADVRARILALRSMVSSGVSSAAYGDKRTEFRSLEELRQILNGLEEELEGLLGYPGDLRQVRVVTEADKAL